MMKIPMAYEKKYQETTKDKYQETTKDSMARLRIGNICWKDVFMKSQLDT